MSLPGLNYNNKETFIFHASKCILYLGFMYHAFINVLQHIAKQHLHLTQHFRTKRYYRFHRLLEAPGF